MIIIVVQWTIANTVPFSVLFHENKIENSVTYCHDFDCRTTINNNPMCIVLHFMKSTLRVPPVVVIVSCT